MADSGRASQRITLAVVFALGIGLGWAGATHHAINETRVRDASGFDDTRRRLDEEEMRLMDLTGEQRQQFLAARAELFVQMAQMFGRFRPETDFFLHQFDQKIRPILSPRQLAVYDRFEQGHRLQMPAFPGRED